MKKWIVIIAISTSMLGLLAFKIDASNNQDAAQTATVKTNRGAVSKDVNLKETSVTKETVSKQKAHYGKEIHGLLNTTIEHPKVSVVKRDNDKVVQLRIPYAVSVPDFFKESKSLKFERTPSQLIRIKAAGKVWRAEPGPKISLDRNNSTFSETIVVNLPIKSGYSEEALKDFKLFLMEPTHTTTTVVYALS